MNTIVHFADKEYGLILLDKEPSSSQIEEISNVQANDGITHYYYLKDKPERITHLFSEGECFILYLKENRIVAFLSIRLIPHLVNSKRLAAQIRFIEVDKKHQSQGIATRLVQFALELAFCNGAEYVLSFVESESDKESFLKMLGCKNIFIDPYYYIVDNNYMPASAWLFPKKDVMREGIPVLQKPLIILKSESVNYYKNDNRVLITKFNNINDLSSLPYGRLYIHQECENLEDVVNFKIITKDFGILYLVDKFKKFD